METKHQIDARTLGIDLSSKTERQAFRWLLACLLLGKPIRQEIARRAYDAITAAGVTSLTKLGNTDWDALVALLDEAHYVRYDFSTATTLLRIAHELKAQYGSVTRLLEQSADVHELEECLITFKGIGPVTAALFAREVAPYWFAQTLPRDYEAARRVAGILGEHGFEAYIIGGAVRDLLLNRRPKDFDVATNATPERITAIAEFEHAKYKDTAQAYGVTRVVFAYNGYKAVIEIATFRKDVGAHKGRRSTTVTYAGLEEDVLRRDFTVNGLALNLTTDSVVDFVGGIDDIERRVVRFIGNPDERIREDPLRIMRAIRFKNHLGFSYAPDTAVAIRRAVRKGFIELVAVDRMRDELTALFVHSTRRSALADLDSFGILERIVPEVTAGKGVEQPPEFHAEGDVWQHELLIFDYLPAHPSKLLAWAALLHDIGKGPSRTEPHRPGDRVRFHRHYAVGAEMAKTVLRRLRFSKRDIRDITWMIYNHMAIDDLPAMRPSNQQRMMSHEAFEDLLELHRADAAASWRPSNPQGVKPRFRAIERLWHAYQITSPEKRRPSLKRDLGIDGTWLRDTFGSDFPDIPGPVIGEVLSELQEWYADNKTQNIGAYRRKAKALLEGSQKRHEADG